MGSVHRCWYAYALVLGLVGQLVLIACLRDSRLPSQSKMQTGGPGGPAPVELPQPSSDAVIDSDHPLIVVILSSSPRSGSSLLGEMLSTSSNTAYFFEPFFYHIKQNISIGDLPYAEVRETLKQLLTCRLEGSPVMREARFRSFVWKSPPTSARLVPAAATLARRCRGTRLRVVKLVRPRLAAVLPLLDDPQLGRRVRLLHLVRDPRGSINSLLRASSVWRGVRGDLTFVCRGIRADLAAARPLADRRFLRVRYEQLVTEPRRLVDRLYHLLGLPQPASLRAYLDRHMNATQPVPEPPRRRAPPAQARRRRPRAEGDKAPSAYFSTYRAAGFDPHHWRRELKPEVLAQIEQDCADVIAELSQDPAAVTLAGDAANNG